MLRNTYIRLTQYKVPPNTLSGYLHLLAMVSEPIHFIEGILLEDVRVNRALKLQINFYDGVAQRERLGSSPILRIESGYVLSEKALYQILRVAPYSRGKAWRA